MAEGGIGYTEPETGNVPKHSSLYSRYARNHVESVSVEICSIMTRLGYGEEIRRWRVEKFREFDRQYSQRLGSVTCITAGSKAEGLTCLAESDWDSLYVLNNVLCVEAGINLHITDNTHLFKMDTRVYPGHCRLLQERRPSIGYKAIDDAVGVTQYGDVILSSSLFLNYCKKIFPTNQSLKLVTHKPAGPSLPRTIGGFIHTDSVFALPCQCPSILQRWAARPRHWPPPVIVQKVVSLGAYLTPVGFKGSKNKHVEWRICFNTGETELVNNLNDTQAKVYVILKMILKDILKPNNKEITSYVLKNIVLWQGERNPQAQFHACNLIHLLNECLRDLRTAVAEKHMPYYMIPERNLMEACGMTDVLQRKWVADITDMLEEGPGVILRLEKIRKAIVASPLPMLWFSKKRMEIEMLQLQENVRRVQCINENLARLSDFIMKAICRRRRIILMEMRQVMLLDGSSLNDENTSHTELLK